MGAKHGADVRSTPSPRLPLFAPKTTLARVRPGTVARKLLVDRLCTTTANEVFVVAPAGYGKSTLAALWAQADPRPFGWVSVDDADRDPLVFLTYLAAALDAACPMDEAVLSELTGAQMPWPALLPLFAHAVASTPEPFVLVVDDVHRLAGPSATEVLPAVAARIPPGSTLAMLTRSHPPYPCQRSVLAGTALRVDVHDLAMESAEAADLLHAAGVDLDYAAVTAVREKTEGWPAGLYISALALRDVDDPVDAVERFTGGDRLVTDYLTEEVLAATPADDVEFLLATAVLTRMSGPLCDEVLGCSGSGATLERLARSNQFVLPLDHRGEWYRYHHLFGGMLHAEMLARAPEQVREVARRASAWFDQRGEPAAAVEHALSADRALAAALIWRASPMMIATDRIDTVGHWLEQYSRDEIERMPELASTAAWHRLSVGDPGAVHRLTAVLDATDGALPDGTPAEIPAAHLRALTATAGLTAMRADAARAYTGYPPDSPYKVTSGFLEASAAYLLGDLAHARDRLEACLRLGAALVPITHAQCLAQLARVEIAEGNRREAERLVDDAMRIIDEHRIAERAGLALAFAIAALVHLRQGRTTLGEAERAQSLRLLGAIGSLSPYQVIGAQLELATASTVAKDLAGARALFDGAERRLARLPDAGTLPDAAAEVRALLDTASAPGAQMLDPLTPAELRVLAYLPTHLSFGEIGTELFLSRNTVKSHAMSIYRKLAVTSRSAAVAEATRLGLFDVGPS